MDEMLEVMKDVYAIINNVLIARCDVQHYDQMLKEVIIRATEYSLTLISDKYSKSVACMRHVIIPQGLQVYQEKAHVIIRMQAQTDTDRIRRFLCRFQYVSKFTTSRYTLCLKKTMYLNGNMNNNLVSKN